MRTYSRLPEEESIKRFHANYVKRENGCWEWIAAGARNGPGQGRIRFRGEDWIAYRLSYYIHKGEIGDKFVCHSCDDSRCVNPDHLWLGTQAENIRDRDAKGRHWVPIGEERPTAKLTEEKARDAFLRHRGGESQNSIAKSLGVSQGTIHNVVFGRSWNHATGLPKTGRVNNERVK